jgi:trk system potassium uptake protein TrkH
MQIKIVLHILGLLLIFLALTMLLPLPFSWYFSDGTYLAFLSSGAVTFLVGILLYKFTTLERDLRSREGFAIVTLTWVSFSLFGALPFIFSGAIPDLTDAFFETMSGFTTTGATILPDIEVLPPGILFWRSLTHWLGGMGIIVLSIAILPLLGAGGMQLFKREVPGPLPDKLTPRVTETAKILWGVYLLFSVLEVILLMLGGMNFFDSLCHTFGTMATGGFSTKNASVGSFNNAFIEYTIIIFMFAAAVNFSLHYQFLRGNLKIHFRNREFLFFIGTITTVTLFLFIDLFQHHFHTFELAFRKSLFQVVSIITTTGFITADYEQWSFFSQFTLLLLMLIGGCAGSTAGGMKVIRFYILIQFIRMEIRHLLHPSAVLQLRVGEKVIPKEIVTNILGFLALMMGLFCVGVILMTMLGLDIVSAMGAVAATLGNVGPGLGLVGPIDNYSQIPFMGKWILSFLMLAGRLEIYTVLILLAPSFWQK